MQIQILGYILIPLGLIFLFKDIKYLLYLVVFFCGFTGTSIINFGKGFSLLPTYYFGLLFILKYIAIILKKKSILKPNILIIIFIMLCTMSLIMPNLANAMIIRPNDDVLYSNVTFSGENIKQLAQLIFTFLIYLFIKDYCGNDEKQILKIIKILVYSCITICILGIYQEFAFIKNLEFDKIFRSANGTNVQPFGDFVRVYSVTPEPSMLSYFLAPMLALMIFLDKKIIKRKYIIILLTIITGIMSTSTTFVLGVLFFILKIALDKIALIIKGIKKKRYKTRHIALVVILVIIIFLISINSNDKINNLLTIEIYNKIIGNNSSADIRSFAFTNHFNVALQYPFLGIGIGSARSKDLLSTLLCNVGFITTGVFLVYIYTIINKLKYIDDLAYGVSNYIFVLFACAFISVPELYFIFIWIIFAIAEAIINRNTVNKCVTYRKT